MGLLKQIYENPVMAGIALLKQLQITVTDSTVNDAISNHPDYPSLLSISDSFNQWHIKNISVEVEKERLSEIPVPFIAHTYNQSFITVISKTNDTIQFIDDSEKIKSLSFEEFNKIWNGIVLMAEKQPESGEASFIKKRNAEKINSLKVPALISFFILIIAFAIYNSWHSGIYQTHFLLGYSFLLFLNLAGIFISTLLLWYEMDRANPMLQKICSGGERTNCNAILQSKYSKIFPWLSWSEAGFFYFAGCFLSLVFNKDTVTNIAWMSLSAVLYIIFSVYYQWKIAKQWCPLCLSVQAVLLASFIVCLSTGLLRAPIFSSIEIFTIFVSFVLPAIAWYFLKPLLQKNILGKRSQQELNRFKYNPHIFQSLLSNQQRLENMPNNLGIHIGNEKAINTLIKVCNPYCGPCARAHVEMEKLLEANENLKAQILFTATNKEGDKKAFPVKHLLAIDDLHDDEKTKKALDDWYLAKEKNYEAFAEKYPMNGELQMQDEKVEQMDIWCKDAGIHATPTFFFNGYQLPALYNIKDLNYFLAE